MHAEGLSQEVATGSVTRSRWVRPLLLWLLPLLVVAVGVYWYGSGGRYATTDNAYLKQDRIDVAPQIAGDVRDVRVKENQAVQPGEVVLVLDDTLLQVAKMHAEAELAAARVDVESLRAAYREKLGEVAVARQASHYAVSELGRQQELADRKLVPAATLESAVRSRDLAIGSIAVLELQLEQASARLGGDANRPVDEHPAVRTAAAMLEKTRVDLEHTIVRAPRAGIASHLPQAGDHVEAGRPAFAIVADSGVYVEANFKETDLEWVRPGETATVEIDTYPGREWSGKVTSIAQATGAEFSVLPPQNASGNWVKVVQRVPVRISIEAEADDPPLRSGASADVSIDTGPHTRFDRWFGSRH
ncbi:MAG: HlyD family secretion protein [Proteobacteria bacterium]|nr:HlyD family secretion protein [Pseudomonadota bacterium]